MRDDAEHFSGQTSWEALVHQEHLTPDDAQAFQRFCFEHSLDPALAALNELEDMYRQWRKDPSA